ncbi:hypothetical protein [Blautia intestinalis]|nr:hypothetical protein [Blautia intestinalis]
MLRNHEIDGAGIENEGKKSFRCLGSVKLMDRASRIGKTRISDAQEA